MVVIHNNQTSRDIFQSKSLLTYLMNSFGESPRDETAKAKCMNTIKPLKIFLCVCVCVSVCVCVCVLVYQRKKIEFCQAAIATAKRLVVHISKIVKAIPDSARWKQAFLLDFLNT